MLSGLWRIDFCFYFWHLISRLCAEVSSFFFKYVSLMQPQNLLWIDKNGFEFVFVITICNNLNRSIITSSAVPSSTFGFNRTYSSHIYIFYWFMRMYAMRNLYEKAVAYCWLMAMSLWNQTAADLVCLETLEGIRQCMTKSVFCSDMVTLKATNVCCTVVL